MSAPLVLEGNVEELCDRLAKVEHVDGARVITENQETL